MENIKYIAQASAKTRKSQAWSFMMDSEKEHIAFEYDENTGLVSIITWDDPDGFEEFAEYFGTDSGDWLGLPDAEPMTICSDGCITYIKIK